MEVRLWSQKEATDAVNELVKKDCLPEAIVGVLSEEIRKMGAFAPGSTDFREAQEQFDWFIDLPWRHLKNDFKTPKIRKALDRMIYAQDEVKDKILSFFVKGRYGYSLPVFYLVGPAGTGKTRFAETFARAMGRPLVKIRPDTASSTSAFFGKDHPSEFARIFRAVRRLDPIILVEDSDRVWKKCPLFEIMSSYQEGTMFEDQFLNIPLDLSGVTVIASSRYRPDFRLRPRHTEIIDFHPYTLRDKLEIAGRFIIPDSCAWFGLNRVVQFSQQAAEMIALLYTKEAGAGQMAERIHQIIRHVSANEEKGKRRINKINCQRTREILGSPIRGDSYSPDGGVGKGTGLGWDGSDGCVLPVEVAVIPGDGKLILTGNLAQIITESAQIAFTHVKKCHRKYGIKYEKIEKSNIHLHVEDASTPKDGPSMGALIAICMISALKNKAIKPRIAVTGEVNLSGEARAIGGLSEKVEAAIRNGIKKVMVPKANFGDLIQLRGKLERFSEIILYDDVYQLAKVAIDGKKAGKKFKRPRS